MTGGKQDLTGEQKKPWGSAELTPGLAVQASASFIEDSRVAACDAVPMVRRSAISMCHLNARERPRILARSRHRDAVLVRIEQRSPMTMSCDTDPSTAPRRERGRAWLS